MAVPQLPPTFGQTFGQSLATGLGTGIAGGIVGAVLPTSSTTTSSGTSTAKLDLSQEGYDKIIKDILSSDAGLAALATGENLSGGYGSSVKAQLAQDLVLNIAGEMAKLTAPTTQTNQSKSKTKKKLSVICTELARQGKLPQALYLLGHSHFLSLRPQTVAGYRVWADKVVPLMRKSKRLSNFLAPIAISRYRMIVLQEFSLIGAATIYLGQPLCFVIGGFLSKETQENLNGDLSTTTL
jgi:hypothetical protein